MDVYPVQWREPESALTLTGPLTTISAGAQTMANNKSKRHSHNWKDLTGRRFGCLVVQGYSTARRSHWECLCDCGGRTLAYTGNLNNGHTTTCGCGKRRVTHGRTFHPLYHIWRHMKERCLNPDHKSYPRYGGRGIKICEQWINSLQAFAADVGERPGRWASLDRINNDGNYEPGNVRWATRKDQSNNRRSNRIVTYQGHKYTVAQLADKIAAACGIAAEDFADAFNRHLYPRK